MVEGSVEKLFHRMDAKEKVQCFTKGEGIAESARARGIQQATVLWETAEDSRSESGISYDRDRSITGSDVQHHR
jgi:hypothetical protein